MADFILYEDIVGVLPLTDVNEPKRYVRLALEDRSSSSHGFSLLHVKIVYHPDQKKLL
jgi:hypothetical protein